MKSLSEGMGIIRKGVMVNHSIISSEEHINEDLESIEILNSQINGGKYENVNLTNSDLFSTKLFSVSFQNVEFRYSDINSIWASNCIFNDVAFDGSTLTDSTFIECKFINCSFSHIGMSNNQFIKCELREYFTDHCTITLNEFINCNLINFKICSIFYYQIFDDCIFQNVEIEENLLGFNYGILHTINTFNDQKICELKSNFLNSGFLVNAAIVEINYNEQSQNIAMLACIITISEMLRKDMIIKSDELIFIMKLLEYFYTKKMIAPICIVQCWKIIDELQQKQLRNSAYTKAIENVTKLKNLLYINYQKFLSELLHDNEMFPNSNDFIELELHYLYKPKMEMTDIIETIINRCNLSIQKPVLLRNSEGSFLEWIKTNASIVPFIQAFISLLGITVQITKNEKQKNKVHKREDNKITTMSNNISKQKLQAIQSTKTELVIPILLTERDQKTEEIASQMIHIILDNNFIGSSDYLGYNNKNVINVTINYIL